MVLSPVKSLVTARKAPLALAAVSVISVAAMACSGSAAPTATATSTASPAASQQALSGDNKQVGLSSSVPGGIPATGSGFGVTSTFAPVPSSDGTSQQMGIWVTGTGSKDVASDQAQVSIGVQSTEDTVTAARENAANAMTAVLDAIKALGVSEDDIQTTSFNIYPQQTWVDVKDASGTHSEPRIVGYTVSNQVQVTVKDIDILDKVIDAAASQGGDLIRINSINFTVANPSAYGAETRQMAAADAKAKAQLYADAMGVNLGPLVYLTEISSSTPVAPGPLYARAESGADASMAPTPIQSGDVSLSTTIQAAFAIVP